MSDIDSQASGALQDETVARQEHSHGAPASAGQARADDDRRLARRRNGFRWLVALLICVAAIWWAWKYFFVAGQVATDNAYVHGNVVVVTPQIDGTIAALMVEETEQVDEGQLLVSLDATDVRNRLKLNEARLALAVRDTRALFLNTATLRSAIALHRSRVERARTELRRADDSVRRRLTLQPGGAISAEELQIAQSTLAVARSDLAAAQAALTTATTELEAHLALISELNPQHHPVVQQAAAEMREAWLAVRRAEIRAPIGGQIVRKHAEIGQRVAEGADLMSIVALDQLWVEANFKENQLRDIRLGQPVRLYADIYGSQFPYDGCVAGIGAGTGAAFALLPAQNATGNWVKIVQRLPVRIKLEPAQLRRHPLRIGLSMRVEVDTSNTDATGRDCMLPSPPTSGDRLAQREQDAERAVRSIIDAHLSAPR